MALGLFLVLVAVSVAAPEKANPALQLKDDPTAGDTDPSQLTSLLSSFDCDFEGGFCGWTQDSADQDGWVRSQGPDGIIRPGPVKDHTTGSPQGWYVYNGSPTVGGRNTTARLVSQYFPTGPRCIRFYLSMRNVSFGQFHVYMDRGDIVNTLFTKEGSTRLTWDPVALSVNSSSQYKIVLEAMRHENSQGDIALDDIYQQPGACPFYPQIKQTPIIESRALQPKVGPIAASTTPSQSTSRTQLDFSSQQQGRDVSINCTLRNASTSDLSLVISMAVSRITDTEEESVLASVTSLGSAPVTHGGAVTSSVSLDGRQESYVNIEWSSANSSLEGDYMCRVNGLDINNLPIVLSQELSLVLQEPGPGVRAIPEILELGLTKSLTTKCYIFGLASHNLSEVTSIGLSYIHDGIDQLLVTHSVFEGTEIKPGSGVLSSVGHLSTVEEEENFLEATWQNPGLNRTGKYECSFSGLDTAGHPVYFESTFELNHVEPSKEELIQQLEDLRNQFQSLTQENEDLIEDRDNTQLKIRVLQESATGHKICDTVDLPVGQYPITLFPDDGQGLVEVLCDVVSPGDVWTIFQKRFNGSESFSRGFVAYDVGFGSVQGEHWLGFKQMKRIMTAGKYQIRVDLADHKGASYTRIYPQFSVGAADGYTLTVDGYNDGGHGLSFSSGAAFSTLDHGPQPHCAAQDNGGWWYDNCAYTNLNGQWGHPGESGVSWFELPDGRIHPLTKTEMKFKKSSQP